jgi:hypothetical protein
MIIRINEVTLSRSQIADIFAQGEKRVLLPELGKAPPEIGEDATPREVGLLLADYFIELACEQCIYQHNHFDPGLITIVRAENEALKARA